MLSSLRFSSSSTPTPTYSFDSSPPPEVQPGSIIAFNDPEETFRNGKNTNQVYQVRAVIDGIPYGELLVNTKAAAREARPTTY